MTRPDHHSTKPRCLLIGSFFLRHLGLEGVGTFIAGLAQGMTAQGWRVTLVLPAGSDQRLPATRCCESILTYAPGISAVRTYGRLMADQGPGYDRILLVENNPNSLAAISRLSGIALSDPRVYSYVYTPLLGLKTLRDLAWRFQAWLHVTAKWHGWARLVDWRQAKIIVASAFQQQQLLQVGARQVTIVQANTIPHDAGLRGTSDANMRQDPELTGNVSGSHKKRVFTIGYVGHFSPAKGVGLLLEAFADARRRHPMRLLIAHSGKGRLIARHQGLLARLIADQDVKMTAVVDPVAFLAACDVTVLPYPSSSVHHLPLVLIESLAAGTPVVTTAVGGLGESVVPGKTGFVVPPNDMQQLSDKITWLASHPDDAGQMGTAARRFFEQNLSRDVFCRQLDTILWEDPGFEG